MYAQKPLLVVLSLYFQTLFIISVLSDILSIYANAILACGASWYIVMPSYVAIKVRFKNISEQKHV